MTTEEATRSGGPPPGARGRVGRFLIYDELGRGGMGQVFRAWDESLKRHVALKVLVARPSDTAGRRFAREAEALARLRHPGIVGIYEVGEADGKPFIAMELVAGEPLATRLKRGKLAPREAAALLRDVARAVHHAHEHGIVHRDLKPANVIVEESGAARVLDFGLVAFADDRSKLTKSGTFLGTPHYMSPEQVEGKNVDVRSDVWSLGAVLYEALAGKPPFDADSAVSLIAAVMRATPEAPSDVPPALGAIALRCLEKDPARRPASAAELADALDGWLRGEVAPAPSRALAPLAGLVCVAASVVAWALAPRAPTPPPPSVPAPGVPAPVAPPKKPRWTRIDAIPKTTVQDIAIDRRHRAIVATYPSGIWIGGRDGAWRSSVKGLAAPEVLCVIVDSTDPLTFWAGTIYSGGFHKSDDGGETWRFLSHPGSGRASTDIRKIVQSPRSPDKLWAATAAMGIVTSADGGSTWTDFSDGLDERGMSALIMGPSSTLWCAGDGGVFVQTPEAWRSCGLKGEKPAALAADPVRRVVWVCTPFGVHRTADSGATWSRARGVPGKTGSRAIAIDPRDPRSVYVGTFADGVLVTRDDGASWTAIEGLEEREVTALALDGKTIWAGAGDGLWRVDLP